MNLVSKGKQALRCALGTAPLSLLVQGLCLLQVGLNPNDSPAGQHLGVVGLSQHEPSLRLITVRGPFKQPTRGGDIALSDLGMGLSDISRNFRRCRTMTPCRGRNGGSTTCNGLRAGDAFGRSTFLHHR